MIDSIVQILILLFSITIHEVSHGQVANFLGDDTAKRAGRLTLNPLKHLDLVGSVIVPAFLILTTGVGFGWAKPVPVNPANLKDKKYGFAKVSVAGPLANLFVALFFGLLLRFWFLGESLLAQKMMFIFGFIVYVNLTLAVFNLIPLPPLDGSHLFFALLPSSLEGVRFFLWRYGFFLFLFFVFFLFRYLDPLISFFFRLIVGG